MAVLLLAALTGASATADRPAMPAPDRTVIALYEGGDGTRARYSRVHQIAQMPLNHLGLHVVYYDVTENLPSDEEIADAHGLLTWFDNPDAIAQVDRYLGVLQQVARTQTKFVMLGHPGFRLEDTGGAGERALRRLGIDWTDSRVQVTFDSELVHAEPELTGFERDLPSPLPAFPVVGQNHSGTKTWIRARSGGGRESHLVMTSPKGGFAALNFAVYREQSDDGTPLRAWLIDPFRFFARAFDTDEKPKPDPTTRVGRRVYYSHIDGDGWLNRTMIERYSGGSKEKPPMAAEVIRREIFEAYPQMPVTVAPIAAELDTDWFGSAESRDIARRIFAMPHIEVGNHTYSHPFAWDFFQGNDHRERERRFFDRYPGSDRLVGALGRLRDALGLDQGAVSGFEGIASYPGYERPRAYAIEPFSINLEIDEATTVIAELAPPGKAVGTYQWSGNTAPFAEMIGAVERTGMANINGGDSRFDPEYPSYAWSAPYGIDVDGHWQVFASNSNENTYTENWTGRYFGFRYLIETLRNEERPRRISAFNVYYHMYSGDRQASLAALKRNLDYAVTQPLVPVATSTYARAVQGFRTMRFQPRGEARWAVLNRGELHTVRFDRALFKAVDFARSHGVLGQRHLHGRLYVALDPAVDRPVIALRTGAEPDRAPRADPAYLIEAAWDIRELRREGNRFSFRTAGYLDGAMRWYVGDQRGRVVTVRIEGQQAARFTVEPDVDGEIAFDLGPRLDRPWPKGPATVTIVPVDA
ncbi:hypothetical protein CKO28_14790 [Rhodovibrio sodomensis]|uniref:Polysaccharide deacetylase n=2 Tax=Rhodovibrio sodomensis TaxID=1088 RepID=A0ABS1DGS3_9PROT|nr:hypothetical protein [Rhodovibrio sodomensis]